ncbi:MAG: hypothetical protein PHR39_07935 [Actinomycetota bacterium]|nr:hypothetical protein [Actinomycetota bacterium]
MILKESLEGITKQQWADNVSDKLSEKLKEGNLTQATILVIEDIADEFIEEQVENIWIDLADRKIRIWENSEIEGAYQVFKNGVDSESLWGYKVIAGDFDNLWTQMKGIAEEIVNMDLSSYCRINNKKIDELSEEELTKIKEDVKQRTKAQFEERLQQDEEVEKIKIENKKMIEILNQKGLLNLELTNPAFNAEDDLMTLINRIYVKIENVKKDTGRFDVAFPANEVGKTDELKKEAMINAEDLADLIYIWFGEGDDSYKQAISDRKLIIEQPEIQDEDVIIEVVNMSLDDYWQRDDGLLIEIQGSEGYFRSFSSSWQIMAEQGIVALGDAKMKNIVQLGENIWSCDDLWYADKEEGSEIYWSDEAEITMSNDGKSIVIITKATNPLSGEKKEGSRTFYRYVEGQDLQIQDEKTEQKESQEPAEIGLDGYWKGKYDFIIKIDGDKSTFIQFSSGQQKYADLGMVSLGDLQMKEIEKIGENKWSCYILYFFSLDDKPYSVGWSEKSTITMSANGKTITLNSTGKHPKTGKVFTNESEYSRTIPPIAQ